MSVSTRTRVEQYLEETVRIWLGLRERRPATLPTLPNRLSRLLLRLEEHEDPRRDRWGCWDFEFSDNAARIRVPEIDNWLADQRRELARMTALEPLWPNGHRFAFCLTHDVDLLSPVSTPRQIARFARAGLAGDQGARDRLLRLARPAVRVARSLRNGVARTPSTAETLERSVELEAQHGASASYLFTVPPIIGRSRYDCVYAPQDPCLFRGERTKVVDVMRTLAVEGFDVGLHGSYEGAFRPGALAAERAALQRATGLEITSTRQHFLHWDVRRTPRLQEDAGLSVDSSLGFNREIGFRAGTSLPFRLFDHDSSHPLELLEVPLVTQDGALLGPLRPQLDIGEALAAVDRLVDAVSAVGGLVTFVFHPDKLVRPDWLALYERALKLAVERQAWLTSLRGLETWWREREARILDG